MSDLELTISLSECVTIKIIIHYTTHYLLIIITLRVHDVVCQSSVRNGSAIIAHYGLSNAKPLIIDLILWLPETNFRLRNTTEPR